MRARFLDTVYKTQNNFISKLCKIKCVFCGLFQLGLLHISGDRIKPAITDMPKMKMESKQKTSTTAKQGYSNHAITIMTMWSGDSWDSSL